MKIVTLFMIAYFVGAMPGLLACVGCRTPGEGMGGDPQIMVQAGLGFSWSVLFLLVVVITLVSLFSVYIAKTCQAMDRKHSDRQP